jgi:hypothetical protein
MILAFFLIASRVSQLATSISSIFGGSERKIATLFLTCQEKYFALGLFLTEGTAAYLNRTGVKKNEMG